MITLTSILSALSFYIFPTLVGRALYGLKGKDSERSFPLINYFVLGSLFVFGLALLENYFIAGILGISFIQLFRSTVYALAIGAFVINVIFLRGLSDMPIRKYIEPTLFSTFLAAIVFYLWHLHTPYPLNWDFLEHQTLINTILGGKFSYITSHISDTFIFNGYSSMLHTLIATSGLLIGADTLSYWTSISFLHLTSVIFASYLLAKVVTGNEVIAQISAILGAFVFETLTFTSLFFIPQTFTGVIFIFLFCQLLKMVKSGKLPSVGMLIAGSFFLILNHYVIGLLATMIYIGTYFYFKNYEFISARLNKTMLVELGFIAVFLLILFSSYVPLGFLNQGEAEFFNFTLLDKFSFIQRAYGYSMLLFLPLGIFAVYKIKRGEERFILFLTIVLLAVFLMHLPYMFKFYVLGRFFVHLIMAIGIYHLLGRIKSYFLYNLALLSLIAVFTGIFITNTVFWKNILYYHDTFAHISSQEIDAANFIKTNYGNTDALIVSDPATQNILEGLSGVNSQGGTYANQNTRNNLIELANSTNTGEIRNKLYYIDDAVERSNGKRLFILSGRYFQWQKANNKNKRALNFNIWSPADLTFEDEKFIQFLMSDPLHFNLVYKNQTLAIAEVTR